MAQGQGRIMIRRFRARWRRPMNLDQRNTERDRRAAMYDARFREGSPR